MNEISVRKIDGIANAFGFDVTAGSPGHANIFIDDMADSDKYEFGRTPLRNWKAALHETLENTDHCFVVTSAFHGGSAIFGLQESGRGCAQAWLLQSKSFAAEASRYHGSLWPKRLVLMTTRILDLFQQTYPLLYNFIPESQISTIRWLQHCGFRFYACKRLDTDLLFFGKGEGVESFVNDLNMWRSHLGDALREESTVNDRDTMVGNSA